MLTKIKRNNDKSLNYLNNKEQNKIKDYLISNLDNKSFCILLSLYRGIKSSELCTLKYSDIDILAGTLKVNGTIERLKNTDKCSKNKTKLYFKEYDLPKIIPLPKTILETCKELKQNIQDETIYILSNTYQPSDTRTILYYLSMLSKKLNITPNLTITCLQDTFIYNAIKSGVSIQTLNYILDKNIYDIYMRYCTCNLESMKKDIRKIK